MTERFGQDTESEKKEATLENLMTWLTVEMKSRIRAVAPIRSNFAGANKSSVSHFTVAENKKGSFFKCWLDCSMPQI